MNTAPGQIGTNIPYPYIDKWQRTVDLMASIFEVPAGLIMRVLPEEIEVFISSKTAGNPYEPYERAKLNTGLYCETVMASKEQLSVPNALEDEEWKDNPDIELNMISYLGLPLIWPDGNVFGTICLLDDKTRVFSETYQKLLWSFKETIECDFELLIQKEQMYEHNKDLESMVQLRTMSLNREITERKQKEKDLLNYETIVSTTSDQLALLDVNYHYVIVNHAYSRVFGMTTDEVVGLHVADLLGQEAFETTVKPMLDRCLSGEEVSYQSWFSFPEQDKLFLDVNYAPHTDDNGQTTGVIARIYDMTEMKLLNEQLLQARKMELVGQLAGGIAHDFNNALAVVISCVEMSKLELEHDPDHPVHPFLEQILEATTHSTDVTRQLLTFARKQTVTPQVVSINATIENTLAMLQRLISANIALIWQPEVNVWNIRIDPVQIEQILTNLCINARDAMDGNGQILISTKNIQVDRELHQDKPDLEAGEYVRLTVSDNGSGMDKAELDNIFEPFFTTKPVGQGTGLGLASVYGIVQQNDGFIDVDSRMGEGSSFEIYFHRHVSAAPEDTKAQAEHTIPGGDASETILLVEDDKSILKLGRKILEKLGYSVISVANPREAVELVNNQRPQINLLITDVIMPDMNGRELSEVLSKIIPEIKVLYMSGYTASAIENKGILQDGVHFMPKPFYLKDIAIATRRALDE